MLRGLSQPLRALSFEYVPPALDLVLRDWDRELEGRSHGLEARSQKASASSGSGGAESTDWLLATVLTVTMIASPVHVCSARETDRFTRTRERRSFLHR